MPRSRTGCLTCRNRKLKCDERKPVCGQCVKATRQCIPSPGVVFRHQQNASMNGEPLDGSTSGLRSFYGYKETFGRDSVWVKVPRQLTFVHTTNPYVDAGSPETAGSDNSWITIAQSQSQAHSSAWPTTSSYYDVSNSTHRLEALSAAASGDHYLQGHKEALSSADPAVSAANPSYMVEQTSNLSSLLDPRLDDDFTTASLPPSSEVLDASANFDIDPGLDEDVPFLLRYFSEGPGSWMDLFDLNSFFAATVPVEAATCPLLLYAAIALSAKALGRIRESAQNSKQPRSKRTPAQWSHKARYYYDLAISLLRQALESGSTRYRSETRTGTGITTGVVGTDRGRRLSPDDKVGLPATDSDNLVATTAILCAYEFLDASGLEWSRHLDGAKSLFEIAKDGTLPLSVCSPTCTATMSAPSSSTSRGRRAVFWNVCRQEMLNAFINNSQTRLDTSDLPMWRSAGLHISPAGYVVPSNQPNVHEAMADDMISNALIWLIMKLVNFIAAGDDFPDQLGLGIRQTQLLEYWEDLDRQLNIWLEGLPESFRPTSTVWPDAQELNDGETIRLPKKWFARPMCASAMQSFHFARILLLHNKPHVSTAMHMTGGSPSPGRPMSSSLGQRHASYAKILRQSRHHAEEIVSIGLALSNDSARIHSVQPLYTAGQVLGMGNETGEWSGGDGRSKEVESIRSCILNLLQGIQRETGWATEYRMQQLLEEQWGLLAIN